MINNESGNVIISVVICTYNRAMMLKRALVSLIQQSFDADSFEIIIVNNRCTDETEEMVTKFQQACLGYRVVHVYEPRQGAAKARNAGVQKAQGKIIAFLDDDAVASKDWLRQIAKGFENIHPQPDGVGGPIYPLYDGPKPDWFLDAYEMMSHFGEKPKWLMKKERFSGSNQAFLSSVFNNISFDEKVEITGNRLLTGEDDLIQILHQSSNKWRFYYIPDAKVYHSVPVAKMTVSYRIKRGFVEGQSKCMRQEPFTKINLFIMFVMRFLRLIMYLFRSLLFFIRLKYIKNWAVEQLPPVAAQIGFLLGLCGVYLHVKRT